MTLQDGEDGDKKAELAQRVGQQRWGRETERRCAPPQPNGPKNCTARGRGPDGTLTDLRPQRRNASVRSGKGVRGTSGVQWQVSAITLNCVSANIELCRERQLGRDPPDNRVHRRWESDRRKRRLRHTLPSHAASWAPAGRCTTWGHLAELRSSR